MCECVRERLELITHCEYNIPSSVLGAAILTLNGLSVSSGCSAHTINVLPSFPMYSVSTQLTLTTIIRTRFN